VMGFLKLVNSYIMENLSLSHSTTLRKGLNTQNSKIRNMQLRRRFVLLDKGKEVLLKWRSITLTGIREIQSLEINFQVDMVKKVSSQFFGLKKICLLRNKELFQMWLLTLMLFLQEWRLECSLNHLLPKMVLFQESLRKFINSKNSRMMTL